MLVTLQCHRPRLDRLAVVEGIRALFAQSPAFRCAVISDPCVGCAGEVTIEVRFGQNRTALRVVAPTPDEAYAILHELAASMVGTDRKKMRGTRWANAI